jgi:hypothetical protein
VPGRVIPDQEKGTIMTTEATSSDRKLRVLCLDDDMNRVISYRYHLDQTDFLHVDNARQCIRALSQEPWDVVLLDHDLGMSWGEVDHDPGCGMDVVLHLERSAKATWAETLFIVHSLNFTQAPIMLNRLHAADLTVTQRAHAWLDAHDLAALQHCWMWPTHLERWDVGFPPPAPAKRRSILKRWGKVETERIERRRASPPA